MPNIRAVIHVIPANGLHQLVSIRLCFGNIITQTDCAQYAPTVGNDLPILFRRSCMEHFTVELGGSIQTTDAVTLAISIRVAASRQHHAQ